MRGHEERAPIIVSLGGNALIRRGQKGTVEEQFENAQEACALIASLSADKRPIVVTHGNGPVVGNLVIRNEAARDVLPVMPLFISDADSEGGIGFIVQQSIHNHLRRLSSNKDVAAIVTQVVVDPADGAFQNPEKPIGPFYTEEEARSLMKQRGWVMKEDSHRGFRRVVPSPRPKKIIEAAVIARLASSGVIVIAAGGGGVPVVETGDGMLKGIDAVVDKDLSTALLGREIGARLFIDLTSVEAVCLDYGGPKEKPISKMRAAEAMRYLDEGHFAEGSMGPKIEAAIEFLRGGGSEVIITTPQLAMEALSGRAGTRIIP